MYTCKQNLQSPVIYLLDMPGNKKKQNKQTNKKHNNKNKN